MSKWRNSECCYYGAGYGAYGGYGGFGGGYGGGYGGCCYNSWIYALLILILIVLQFGTDHRRDELAIDGVVLGSSHERQEIDNSVLFIIVVFLLIICSGCCGGGYGGYGPVGGIGGYGAYGAYGRYVY